MDVYIPTKSELESAIRRAVENAVKDRIPDIIRRATAKEYLTIAETCEALDCTRRHLQYLRDERKIPHVKHGKKILFRTNDVHAYIESGLIKSGDR
jgi:excisionase family DNA binding protein